MAGILFAMGLTTADFSSEATVFLSVTWQRHCNFSALEITGIVIAFCLENILPPVSTSAQSICEASALSN